MPEKVTDIGAIRRYYHCAWAGHEVVDVWEPAERYERGLPPNRTGCATCEADSMVRVERFVKPR